MARGLESSPAMSLRGEVEMYLGVPGKVLSVDGRRAQVECWGSRMAVRLEAMEEDPRPGDYVLCHAGFAIRRIARHDIGHTYELYEILLRFGIPEASLPYESMREDEDLGPVGRDC